MVHVFFFFLLFLRVIYKEEEIMKTTDPFSMQLSHFDLIGEEQKKISNIYVFVHAPFFPDGKLKLYTINESEIGTNQSIIITQSAKKTNSYIHQLEKYRSFILSFSESDLNKEKENNVISKLNISIESDDDLPFKATYWKIPNYFCKTTANFFISTDYQIKSNVELMENACLFFDPKVISNFFKMVIFSSEQITIEFYINNSLYTNPDYECSSFQPNQTLSCVIPYSQPFFARVVFNKKKFISNLKCVDHFNCNTSKSKSKNKKNHKANFTLDYSSLYKSQEVRDCFIDRIPFIQFPQYSSYSSSSYLSESLKEKQQLISNINDFKNFHFKIENKICVKFSGYKTAVVSRIAIFFSVLFVVAFFLQLIGYIDFCGWVRKPGEVAFVGLREKVPAGEIFNQKKSKNKKHASSMDELNDSNNNDTSLMSPLVFSMNLDAKLPPVPSRPNRKKTVSCYNFQSMSQTGQSRDLRRLSGSGSKKNNKSGSGAKMLSHREVVFQLPNFVSSSPSSSSSSSQLQDYKFENCLENA
ncbi:hypothetical protein M9Y10_028500 [Tritrichomonas musculus]|uniref:Transmembrane protein n=1 Tax=Tritrichomonas musculus TaxID=1915356 RepID=A0ABR2KJJ3_9EUKA